MVKTKVTFCDTKIKNRDFFVFYPYPRLFISASANRAVIKESGSDGFCSIPVSDSGGEGSEVSDS